MKLPSFSFYPGDWLKDASLRRCSHAARGVWMDMLCLMFECDERGVLASGGDPWTLDEVACAVGGAQDVSLACIQELLAKGVASRNDAGAIFSRRLVRDEQIRRERARAGSIGGSKTQANRKQPPSKLLEDEDEKDSSAEGESKGGGEFDEFWSGVPKKIGFGKARKAYAEARKNGATHAEIMAALPGFHAYENGRKVKPDYQPLHPATWLNQERWRDEPTTKSNGKSDPFDRLTQTERASLFASLCEADASFIGLSPNQDNVVAAMRRFLRERKAVRP